MINFKDFITESYDKRSALLPATRALFNKNKVTVDDINHQWNDNKHTIQVTHHNGNPNKPRFIVGFGHMEHKDNHVIHGKHDQNFSDLGHHHVINTIHVENGKIVKSHKPVDNSIKAPILVYK